MILTEKVLSTVRKLLANPKSRCNGQRVLKGLCAQCGAEPFRPGSLDGERCHEIRAKRMRDLNARRRGEKVLPSISRKRNTPITDQVVLDVIARNKKELDKLENKQTETIEGFVYILTNPAWPGWVKIGSAINPFSRTNGYQTGSPFRDYNLEGYTYAVLRVKYERKVQKACGCKPGEEWAKIDVQAAINIMTLICSQHPTNGKVAQCKNSKVDSTVSTPLSDGSSDGPSVETKAPMSESRIVALQAQRAKDYGY